MKNKKIKRMILLGTTVLSMQIFYMPIGMVYAEKTTSQEEESEQAELSSMPNFLETTEEMEPNFFFTQSQIQGTVNDLITVTISSDQDVSKVQVMLPEEAQVLSEQLPADISVEVDKTSKEWVIHSERVQNAFVLPLVFDKAGNYEVIVQKMKAVLEIHECEKMIDSDNLSEKTDLNEEVSEKENDFQNNHFEDFDSEDEKEEKHKKVATINRSLQFKNSLFSYSESDTSINGWSLFIGPGVLGPLTKLSISNDLDDSSEFRYALAGHEISKKILFRKESDNKGLRVKLHEDTTLIAGQKIQTIKGKEYLARGGFAGNSHRGLVVYEGEAFAGSGGHTSSIGATGFPEVSFTANSSFYTVTARLFALVGQNVGEAAINSIHFGEKINLRVKYIDSDGKPLQEDRQFYGIKGEEYEIDKIDIPGYILQSRTSNHYGFLSEDGTVTFTYVKEAVEPVDPLNPKTEIDPENKPVLPEKQGLLSIDFVSEFQFGTQRISVMDQTYHAQPQRLLNEDGSINNTEERPNYIQVSDRRPDTERNGWQLAITQNNQFVNENNQKLVGAQLRLANQQLATVQGNIAPELHQSTPILLIPGAKHILLKARGEEGTGTWVYRLGDVNTAGESVALTVPKGANPEATTYKTTLIWELSAVPEN